MTTRAAVLAAVLLACAVGVFGQDPLKVAPQAYRLQFENEWVKVTRVHYGPRAKVPLHEHTRWPAAYVYLNDAGPIIFRHADWEHPVLTRPATRAGSFRLSPTTAVGETHEVENPADTPSDFLRVEFKTRPGDRNSLRGRFYRGPYPAGRNFRKVEFEHRQMRVTRVVCPPRRRLAVATAPSEPALFIALSPARVKSFGAGGGAEETTLEPGQHVWMAGGDKRRLENLNDAPLELLRFDFKTGPASSAGR
jgi:quercetin dioxygenase-like cupin family protein